MPIYGFIRGIEKVKFNGVIYTKVQNNGNLLIRHSCTGSGVHTYGDWVTIIEAGCSIGGLKRKTCSVCGHTVDEVISATGVHSFGEWVITTKPTCTTSGVQTRTCDCGTTQTQMLDALDHLWEAATCTTPKTCQTCGATEGEALGHTWSAWEEVHPATCEASGMKERTCSVCGEKETRNIPALSHDWDTEVEVVEPTCTEQGYTIHTCNHCGETKQDSYTAPLGHNYVNGICTRCGCSNKAGIVYYGVSASNGDYNSSFILGLENKTASNSHLSSISTRPLENEYIYYCTPTSFGNCTFSYNNFVGGFSLIREGISLTNAGGQTENYNIYKSNQANLGVNGEITIKIEKMGG